MKKITQFIATVLLGGMVLTGCTKSPSGSGGTDAAKFVGTWNGTAICTGSATGGSSSFTWNAGSTGTSLTASGSVGSGSCLKAITQNGTASGNNVSFPTTTYTDNCGNSYTVTETGSLSGSTLTLTETVSGALSASCTFTGTK